VCTGGLGLAACSCSCEKYNPETNTWSPIPDMRWARGSMATAVIDDMIFTIGRNDSIECFSEEKNKWFIYFVCSE
jgi:kelch-like protein 10